MIYQHQEPIRGEPDLIVDGRSWVFAPSGHKRPFDRKIRILVVRHISEENKVVVEWAKKGTYILRYDSELSDHIKSWKLGSRHRVKMWGDRIDQVLPKLAKDDPPGGF